MLNSSFEMFDNSEEEEKVLNYVKENATQKSGIEGPQIMELNTNKAGMKGLDVAKINEIIQKVSKGSKFYQHKEKCQEKIDVRISQMKSTIAQLTKDQIQKAESEMTEIAAKMELTRDLSRTIVHIDMDMFYAAVEMRDEPSLRDKPMAVGSNSMLSTSNYVARKYGVRAAMPGFIGKKLCPDLVIVSPNFNKYKAVSSQIGEIFQQYDPNFCPMSLDEAYLDITDYLSANVHKYSENSDLSPAELVVYEIRKKIEEATQLTASAGIATNTRLAKVCSDMNKPDGQYYLPSDKEIIKKFVMELPVRKVSGVGNVSEQQLRKGLGIITCSDLWNNRGLIQLIFSETMSIFLLRVALGLGCTEVAAGAERDRKSISNETTFQGTSDRNALAKLVQSLCQDLKSDMERKNLYGKVFTLKFKTTDFQVKTRAQSLHEYTQDESVMISVGQKLLATEIDSALASGNVLSLRLLGVRMSTLVEKAHLSSKKQVTLTKLFKKQQSGINNDDIQTECDSPIFELSNDDSKLIIPEPDAGTEEVYPQASFRDIYQTSSCNASSSAGNESFHSTKEEAYVCPVCSKSKFNDMEALNHHLDICLNTSVVKKLVRETNSFTDIAFNASSSSHGSSPTKSMSDSKVKRKCKSLHNKATKKLKPNSINTLHKYLDFS